MARRCGIVRRTRAADAAEGCDPSLDNNEGCGLSDGGDGDNGAEEDEDVATHRRTPRHNEVVAQADAYAEL